jgi:hypothetical protein
MDPFAWAFIAGVIAWLAAAIWTDPPNRAARNRRRQDRQDLRRITQHTRRHP